MIMHLLIAYLVLGFIFAIYWYGAGIYSDITHGPDHKFGYAYKSSFTFMVCGILCIPIVNLYGFYIVIGVTVDGLKQSYRALKKAH